MYHLAFNNTVASTQTLARYLSSVEKRLASVESLVSQLLPGIDLEDVLSSPDLTKGTLPIAASPTSEPFQPGASSLTPGSSHDTPREPVIPEAVPNDADGFNWQEENVSVDGLTDGMAALSVEPAGVGYLGIYIEVILISQANRDSRIDIWRCVSTMFT
jgi:transcriptional regulatory protein GAL4